MSKDRILLDHGSGGKLSHQLISRVMLPAFDDPLLSQLDDGAVLNLGGSRLAFSTDSYVVDPIFFPGGNIGSLAVHGTVNDLAMCGADPVALSVAMIIEEGFPMADLQKIVDTMKQAVDAAGVSVVTGDTKVVPSGAADGMFINTTGIGKVPGDIRVSGANARPGNRILLSGTLADHGIAVLTQREGLRFDSEVKSDTAALNRLVRRMFSVSRDIRVLRDPTRGGLGTTLNEIAVASQVGIRIYEDRLPIHQEVAGICELLGFDPLYLANEGKLIAMVDQPDCEPILAAMKTDPCGQAAVVIGEVVTGHPGKVVMQTRIGGDRIIDMLTGEQLPRIC